MENKTLIMIGLVIAVLVVAFLFATGTLNLQGSKYKSSEEVSGATVGIGSGVEQIGSTLEDIDKSLG